MLKIMLAVNRPVEIGMLKQKTEDQCGTKRREKVESKRRAKKGTSLDNIGPGDSKVGSNVGDLGTNDDFVALLYPLSRGSLIKALPERMRIM